ncbi:hypothetical protein [Aquaticitalea lipolytica]|uniref:hypothetical protein n=1 Tax=Aquaticitalea lipolytica TaxID=1247562 RepID=UPI0024BA679E|nr:hypothetical protein [Aquaticitalea lipolytica]
MLNTFKHKVLFVCIINLIIGFAYYLNYSDATYSMLSSDIQNIIPVAQKFDNQELFKNDLYLNTLDNVRYYTPFYVQSLRFVAKFTNQDYVQALNVIGCIFHILFGVLWFFLLYKFTDNFLVSLIISILIRGLIWLPGYEIWGITGLWSIMPRTLYIALMPLPFLFLSNKFRSLLFGAFFAGLIFNFHPITGLGGILLFCVLLLCIAVFYNEKALVTVKNIFFVFIAIGIGMLPFIYSYFGKTESSLTYDLQLYNNAFNERIPLVFSEPIQFLKQWLQLKTLFFVLPLFGYLFVSRNDIEHFKKAKTLALCTLLLIIIPSLSVYIENFINSTFGLNLRMSFQLIRMQKVAIVPSYFAIAFLLVFILSKSQKLKTLLPYIFIFFISVLVICKAPVFNKVPFVGDDLMRCILPNNISVGSIDEKRLSDYDNMAEFVSKSTPANTVIYGSHFFRGATKRAVVLDSKGASMIIEGNPIQFIKWYEDVIKLEELTTEEDKIKFLKQLKVTHIITTKTYQTLNVIHSEHALKLYKIE